MKAKPAYLQLLICYLLWGFQALYWNLEKNIDSFTLLALRIIFSAIFSVIILVLQDRLSEIKHVFQNKNIMKYLAPSIIFLFGDWAIFIIAVRSGHVLDVSLGYYISPIVLLALGILIFKEKCQAMQLLALGIAFIGVLINAISYGKVPLFSLAVALIWSVYSIIKKNVSIDGVLSIAVETIMMSSFAIIFLILFRLEEVISIFKTSPIFILGSGIITALPMFLYSNSISKLPVIAVCFFQYLGPTLSAICGLLMGEHLSSEQIISLAFFLISITIFTINEIKNKK